MELRIFLNSAYILIMRSSAYEAVLLASAEGRTFCIALSRVNGGKGGAWALLELP